MKNAFIGWIIAYGIFLIGFSAGLTSGLISLSMSIVGGFASAIVGTMLADYLDWR